MCAIFPQKLKVNKCINAFKWLYYSQMGKWQSAADKAISLSFHTDLPSEWDDKTITGLRLIFQRALHFSGNYILDMRSNEDIVKYATRLRRNRRKKETPTISFASVLRLCLEAISFTFITQPSSVIPKGFFSLYRFCDFTYGIVPKINKLTLALCVKMSAATADLTEQTSHISIFHQSVVYLLWRQALLGFMSLPLEDINLMLHFTARVSLEVNANVLPTC